MFVLKLSGIQFIFKTWIKVLKAILIAAIGINASRSYKRVCAWLVSDMLTDYDIPRSLTNSRLTFYGSNILLYLKDIIRFEFMIGDHT